MNETLKNSALNLQEQLSFDQIFYDDAVDLFTGFNHGHLCKYYFMSETGAQTWDAIVNSHADYYIPDAEHNLIQQALPTIPSCVSEGLPLIDFGPGCLTSIKAFALPLIQSLNSTTYIPVDLSLDILDEAILIQPEIPYCQIETHLMDFLDPKQLPLSKQPALGIFTGATVGNLAGDRAAGKNSARLVQALRNFSIMTNNGWLLLSVDTCTDGERNLHTYSHPLLAKLFLHIFHLMDEVLPMKNFDPAAFRFVPSWSTESSLLAHMAIATKQQSFMLGDYRFSIEEGQHLHLGNSYKFPPELFESCAAEAGFEVVKRWDHETPMKLYLLKANVAAAETSKPLVITSKKIAA